MARLQYIMLALIASLIPVHSARILGIFPMWGKSHHRYIQSVMKTLATAGHEVVVYSPFPLKTPHPNYTDVFLENIKPETKQMQDLILEFISLPEWKCLDSHWLLYRLMYKEFIEDPKIVELIVKKEKFDLIILEAGTVQEFVLFLGHVLKTPIIYLQAFMLNNVVNSLAGNDLALSYIPDSCISLTHNMNVYERLLNVYSKLRGIFFYYNSYLPDMEKTMRKKFPDMPPIVESATNISLYFINDHSTVDYAQPRPPNIIAVGGIHIEPSKPLPKDIQQFMDEAADGVVFFSLGTYVPDELKPKEYFEMYNNIFKKLKQRVLWKTRKEDIEGLPKNVMTLKWAPQQDILAHPNCVLFITHGGLLSQHEAVHFGVPVVGIPQFYDQHRNVRFYEERRVGVKVAIDDISEETMTAAIRKILEDPSYRENMKRLSAIFKDRPLSPAESVVFWTEYVLRHGGAAHLRPASTELRWYQLILLDVFLLVLVILTLLLVFICLSLRKIYIIMRKRIHYNK